ncbi:MAG: ribosome small subunit-dependent GTPase A [Ignavibacteria bacterium]
MKGIVSRIESKDYYVLYEDKEIRCFLRGKLKLEAEWKKEKLLYTDLIVVGDYVEFELNEDGTGVIEKIPDRKNYLSRKAPYIKGVSEKGKRFEQIIAANIDYTFCVVSVDKPKFNNRVLDRMLVTAESCETTPIIVINKIDLLKKKKRDYWYELYTTLGYKVIRSSVVTGQGIDEIKNIIQGKTSVFIGHSGVGKSSILNQLDPKINQKVGEVSEAWNKGRHTTVTAQLFKLNENTFVIDTPGVREIEPYGLTREDITHYFKEIAIVARNCKFNTCTHTHEPDCAVKKAVEEEIIPYERYESYLRLVETLDEEKF